MVWKLHEEYCKCLPEHLKVSKLGLWWDLFTQSRKCLTLTFTAELCLMIMKNVLKLTWEIWRILTCAIKSVKNLLFSGVLLNKANNVWDKNVQRGYVSLHWRVMQNLTRNWLAVWKMTLGIWQIFTRALESLKSRTLMWFFCPK